MVDWERFYGAFRQPGFLPGYEIEHHLGGGGFGEVYKARKVSIDKAYAIKFLRVEAGASRDAVERELEQVRLFAAIDHPNLVTIEDMGVVMDVPYLIMGYAGEDTLARRIQRGELEREEALATFVQVCRGVLALHDRRLAHFDLKPGNIFLNGEVARVGDYGLAKLLAEGRQTLSFGRGTPHYMAPEMLHSRADHRADIYSLGVILFESLAFRLPYGDGEASFVREDDRAPDFPSDFPVPLRRVVERSLRLDPAQRYGSVLELLLDLGQSARQGDSIRLDERDGEPVRARLFSPLTEAPASAPALERGGDDLRQAAAELARGAVGVARGVWSGVTERGSPTPTSEPAAREPASATPRAWSAAHDVLAVSGLEEPQPRPSPASASAGRAPRIATIPVPPRAPGGLFGTLAACAVLGAEMLGVLLGGPLLAAARAAGRRADRALRRAPGLLGRGLRMALLLFGLACLGGLVSLVILSLSTLRL